MSSIINLSGYVAGNAGFVIFASLQVNLACAGTLSSTDGAYGLGGVRCAVLISSFYILQYRRLIKS